MKLSAYFLVFIFAFSVPSMAFAGDDATRIVSISAAISGTSLVLAKLAGVSLLGSVGVAGGSIVAIAGVLAWAIHAASEHSML
ncbi:MAG: hypothetical protein WCK49_10250 [Myxococcaceae bacterium]